MINEQKERYLILVLGMHRSGTSVTAHMMQIMGAYLGEDTCLLTANKDNIEGFFEHKRIVEINDELLRHFSSRWFAIKELKYNIDDEFVQRRINQLSSILKKMFKDNNYVCVKDPRISLLLPVWEQVMKTLNVNERFVYVIRNPKECALSLKKRNGIHISGGLDLWTYYNREIQLFLYNKDYYRLYYSDVIKGTVDYSKLNDEIFGRGHAYNESDVRNCVKTDMCHNTELNLSPAQADIYYGRMDYEGLVGISIRSNYRTQIEKIACSIWAKKTRKWKKRLKSISAHYKI